MTVQELRDLLADLDGNSEVRLAIQPNWPFEYSIDEVVQVEVEDFGSGEPCEIVYLGQGSQLAYLPGEACDALGWGR